MRKSTLFLIILQLFFIPATSWLQINNDIHKQLKYRYITIDNGLSNNGVHSICEDKYGYIWIATIYGINRYDGMRIRQYSQILGDSLSLPSDIIYKVFNDSRGTLWIGTDDGLCYYNESGDNFSPFLVRELPARFNDIFDILEDENRHLWFATISGLYLYMPESDSIVCFNNRSVDRKWIMPSDTIFRITLDNRNNLWISLLDKGLCWIDREKGIVKHFMQVPGKNNSLSENQVQEIYEDSRGDIWVGTLNNGINLLNRSDSTFIRFTLDKTDTYSNRVRTIYEDPEGNLFCGTRSGVYLFDRKTLTFKLYANMAHRSSPLSGNSILCSYTDKKNGIWLGTHYGGVNYSNFGYKPFVTYTAKVNDPFYLNDPSVFGITEDSNGNLYIGTEKGVNILSRNSETFVYLIHDPDNTNSISYNDVKSVAIDPDDNLWIGTNNGGLDLYSGRSGKYTHYKHNPNDPSSLASNKVYFVFLDSDNNLWILTSNRWGSGPNGLSFKKRNESSFTNYFYDFYAGIIENAAGNLFIGGIQGFWEMNRQTQKFSHFQSNRILRVMALHEDKTGKLWIGHDNGLARFDPATKRYLHYSKAEGYPISSVYGILSDEKDNLWISTSEGLIKLIGAVVSPGSFSFRLYHKDDGLPSKEFIFNASYRNPQGEMFFGTNTGLVRFFPDQIKDDLYPPNVVISELTINNKTVITGKKVNRRVILKDPIQRTKSITLDHHTKIFSLTFNALHFANPEKNGFKYKLDNFDSDWKVANAYNNYVTYTSLPNGKYTFTVYATNNDGIYSEKPAELQIRVLSPFWQTWLFRIAFILLITLLAILTFRLRMRKVKSQKDILENQVRERTAELINSYQELQEQKLEILKQNEEIQAKNEKLQHQSNHIEENNALLETANNKLQLLNEFGRQITAIHNIKDISIIINQFLKSQVEINIFGIGIYDNEKQGIVYTDFTEEGTVMNEFTSGMDDDTSMGVYCFRNNEIILCNDFENEYNKYISHLRIRTTRIPQSVIYIPLNLGNRKIGIFTLQSYSKNAFSGQILPFVESMASMIAIALDNTNVYEIVRNQNEILQKKKEFLEHLVKERTRDLERAKNKAEESDKLKSAFLANMSHEIRTPLNAIIGFIELLNGSGNAPEEVSSYHDIIKSSGFTLLQLIDDIIDFSKMEAGQMEFIISDIHLDSFLSDIYLTFSEEIRKLQHTAKQNLQIKLSPVPDRKIMVKADSVRLHQIFNNLIGNAIKFTPEGTIEFGIREIQSDGLIMFFVKDTGIGIEKKYQEVIFNRFVKIEEDKSILYRGTGLGLTITKYLVETMGGKIWVESERNEGSAFMFTLPYDDSPETSHKPEKHAFLTEKAIPDWSNKRFLVAEDDESNYLVLNSLLRKTGVKVSRAHDGEEAVRLYQKYMHSLDLVLLDIKMPRMDGFQVIEAIKELNPDAVVIAQTAYALANEEYTILKAGFNGYISKPFTMQSLINAIAVFVI